MAPAPRLALLAAALLCAPVRGDGEPPDPVFLPVELEVLGVPEFFRLQRVDQDVAPNSSLHTRSETFLLLRAGSQPLVQATYPPFSIRQEVPLESPSSSAAWAIRAVSLESSVSPAEPMARVLFHLHGPDWMPGKKDHARTRDHPKDWDHPGVWDHPEVQGHPGGQGHPRDWDHPREQDHLRDQDHPGVQHRPRNWDHPGDRDHPRDQDHPEQRDHHEVWHHPKDQDQLKDQHHPGIRDHPKDQDHHQQQDHHGNLDSSRDLDHSRAQDLPCVTLHAHHRGRVARGTCRLQAPLGVCVVELEIPPRWFSLGSLHSHRSRRRDSDPLERPEHPAPAELRYSVGECGGREQEAPRFLGMLELRAGEPERRQEVRLDEKVLLRVPNVPLRPGQRFTATIALRHNFTADSLTLRIKAKKGLQVVSARPTIPSTWSVHLEHSRGPKHSTAVVTCRRLGDIPVIPDISRVSEPAAFLHLDVAVENGTGGLAPARPLTWQVEYPGQDPEAQKDKLVWEIQVSERDVRALVPLVQELEILNTAPLTGIPRVIPVKLVTVEAGGGVSELTDPVGCESADKQVLQVSDSCDLVFVGGKESRGARGARVDFWVRRLRAELSFSVWAPLLPLRVQLGDPILEQLRGWRLPGGPDSAVVESEDAAEEPERRARGCRPQFQRTGLRVLAHFVAHPLDGGRHLSYLPGPEWLLDVTHLVAARTRVQDPRVASLEAGAMVVGREPGVTSVEVRSPLSDSILGEQTLVVSEEKVTVTELHTQVVAGLSLSLRTQPDHPGVVTATAQGTPTLRALKQEATLSIWLSFSDRTLAPLELYGWHDVALTVTSLDRSVATITGSPGVPTAHPWVVAEGPGRGDLLQLSLHPPDPCRRGRHRAAALATGTAWLEVGIPSPGTPRPFPRAEGAMSGEAVTVGRRDPAGVGPAATKLQGSSSEEDEEEGYGHNRAGMEEEEEEEEEMVKAPERVTDLEIGMYVLLGVFCLAIFIFLVNCIFFVLRYQQKELPEPGGAPSAPQPHNWVWLGTDQEELSRQLDRQQLDRPQLDRRQPDPPASPGPACGCGGPPGSGEGGAAPGSPGPGTPQPRKEGSAPGGGRRKRVEFVTFAPPRVPEEPPPAAPHVQSILVASEDDIRWVCEDMGLRDPEELRSYMERIRGSS
ncbi:PREDICTED: transmembrane protein 132A [Pseudopodoces humilis]|uniref:transmembrane protein 132A n=1 Tax=Pseudopodoces humilis TaxID=181119 RepID=UPI0006B6F71F|nr:PREDICTED: transmembrane protein 132A [Pseudopodoces humilis]